MTYYELSPKRFIGPSGAVMVLISILCNTVLWYCEIDIASTIKLRVAFMLLSVKVTIWPCYFQEPTLGIDLSFVFTRELLTSSAPLMWWSRSLPLQLNLVLRWKLLLPILKFCQLPFWHCLVLVNQIQSSLHVIFCLKYNC